MQRSIHFFFLIALIMLLPTVTNAAVLYTEIPDGPYGPGDTFLATIRLDNQDECINAGRVVLTYPKDTLKAVDFSRGASLFTLWIEDPLLNNERGEVVFEGGIPGGYCGRIQGDPALSNILGKVVFTVINTTPQVALVAPSADSALYISDGIGTQATLQTRGSSVAISDVSSGVLNPWLSEVTSDTVAPDEFLVRIESTKGVFNGYYYAVFSTVDKQSGLSHFEFLERGVWKRVVSPHVLRDQSLEGGIEIKAIDKAGNERIGTYNPETVPERKVSTYDRLFFLGFMVLLFIGGLVTLYIDHKQKIKKQRVV